MSSERPRSRRGPGGVFVDPWFTPADRRSFSHLLRWRLSRLRESAAPDPRPEELPAVEPQLGARVTEGARLTWDGHSTYLIHLPGANILADPVSSRRVLPVRCAGPGPHRP